MEKYRHLDCEEYLAVDVFKGFCRLHDEIRVADEDACDDFHPAKKCKFCKNYTQEQEFLGKCKSNVPVFPDLLAKTCKDFEWKT